MTNYALTELATPNEHSLFTEPHPVWFIYCDQDSRMENLDEGAITCDHLTHAVHE